MIPFNIPYLTGNETIYIEKSMKSGKISGNGYYTINCQKFFEDSFKFNKSLLTTSCTDSLEMAAILCDIKPGDEVIVPSYTFVSTANAFILRGASIIFGDCKKNHPCVDEDKIEELITPRTKVIVPVHYAGVACDMDKITQIAHRYGLMIVEDAAQAIDSRYKGKALGGIGNFGCFSFHETKNIHCGEGGMLVVNDEKFARRAEIIWEKGTNRAAFFRGLINKYQWVDIGSSFLPSEISAAFLMAQIEQIEEIQRMRKRIWANYYDQLKELEDSGIITLPVIPAYAENNAHLFYIICRSLEERTNLISYLNKKEIYPVFHYLCLHKSDFYRRENKRVILPNAEKFEDCLLRLPFYPGLLGSDISLVCDSIKDFYKL